MHRKSPGRFRKAMTAVARLRLWMSPAGQVMLGTVFSVRYGGLAATVVASSSAPWPCEFEAQGHCTATRCSDSLSHLLV
eukprot:11182417-Alexandrium_andersonii.AAC.1